MAARLTVVWSEPRTAWPTQKKLSRAVLDPLAQIPEVDLAVIPHLYDLAPDGAGVEYLRSIRGPMLVLAWLYPRATYWLLDAHGIEGRMGPTAFFPVEELPEDVSHTPTAAPGKPASAGKEAPGGAEEEHRPGPRTIWCIDLREHDEPEALVAEVGRIVREAAGRSLPQPAGQPDVDGRGAKQLRRIDEQTRSRWYPVVDYHRCTNCLECLNFCLFGVFDTADDESLLVVLPDACRAGCPACARVCPSAAIMFPMHSDPAIAGDPRAALPRATDDLLELAGSGPAGTARGNRDLAERERRRAWQQSQPKEAPDGGSQPTRPKSTAARAPDDRNTDEKLDRLVDELDRWEQADR